MSKRRETPALFELVRASGIKRPEMAGSENPLRPVPRANEPVAEPVVSAASSTTQVVNQEPTTFGRTIRLPMGYVFLAAAGMIVMLVIAYSVGFSRGGAESRAKKADLASFGPPVSTTKSPANGNENSVANQDSLRANNSGLGVNQPRNEAEIPRQPATSQPQQRPVAGAARDEDTRESGLNYIIVEQFDPEEADAVAEFLLARGIDVMVLPTNNRNLRMVVVREGYRGWSSNQAGQAMLRKIRDLGRIWASNGQGSKNFSKAYGKRSN